MKIRNLLLPAAFLALTASAFQSCSGGANADTIEFETRADSVGYLVPDYYGDSVYCAAKYSVVWPSKIGKQDFDALKDSLMEITFGVQGVDFDKASKDYLRSGLNNLIAADDTVRLPFETVPYLTANDEDRVNINNVKSEVTLLTLDLLVIGVNHEVYYYGAAHGMRGRLFLNYSIKNHQLLTAENVFLPGNEKGILSIISAAAAEQYPQEGVLFDAPIQSYGNFQITENDFIFVYQPYEIAPYSSGIIEITVSAQDLYRFLTADAIKALSL